MIISEDIFMFKAKPEDLKVGDYVSWGTSASDARGRIVDVKTDGEVNSSISDYTLTGTPDDPAYVIKLVQKDQDGNDVLTEQTVVHRADALRKIPDPIKSFKTFLSDNIKMTSDGKVSGYLVRFGNLNDTDLEKDYFTKSTDFGVDLSNGKEAGIGLYYNHGMDPVLRTKKIGYAQIKMDDRGVWLRGQLDMADDYNKMIFEMAKMGKLGLSSGAASHLVEREKMGKSFEIKRWTLAEASLTPQPAEHRNMVEAKRYYNEMGRFVPYSKEELALMEDKEYNDYMRMISENMPMKSDYEEEESDDVEGMIEGLEIVGASPEQISMTLFDGIEEDLISDTMHCLYKRMLEGVMGVYETSGDPMVVNAILQEFHMRALDLFNKLSMSEDATMMMEMDNMKSILSHAPKNIKEVERSLRDALDLSRSKAKTLAKLVWENLRDVELPSEPETKTKQIDIEKEILRKDLLKRALKYRL
jgi:HK97 family phage prohead protease